MYAPAVLAFLHHVAAFVLVGALMVELVLLREQPTLSSARALLRMDAAYGICAGALVIVGFLRVFYTEKGAAYYFDSGAFIAKIAAFVIVAILSIWPTKVLLAWRKTVRAGQTPRLEEEQRRSLRRILHIELTLIVVMMLCAALMARGIGFIG
jgi:putative membrane protein